jgi:lipopolysaccharide export system permease protein
MPSFAIRRIDRYIFGQLSLSLVLVTAGLVALIWLTQSLRFIQIIVNRGLSPLVFVKLTLLLVPSFAATILPITCFIVVVFIYGRLSGDRELTVMRATGMSDFSLARPALVLAALVVALCYWLNIMLVPESLTAFRNYQYEIRNQIAAFLLEPGVFTPVSDNLTVYVQSRDAQGGLQGILIEDNRQKSQSATILARSGQLEVTPQGPIVILEDGSREQVNPRTARLDVLTFHRNVVNLAETAKSAAADNTDAAAEPLADLLAPAVALTDAERAKWLVEAQRRLSAPLTAMSFTLIGLLAVLGGKFRRHGGLLRPLGAVAFVTLLVATALGVNNFAARNLDLLPLIWIAILCPGLVAAVLLFIPRRFAPARLPEVGRVQ